MRYKIFLVLAAAVTLAGSINAQAPADTIYEPQISYAGVPRTYEIAGIEVSGADNYDANNIIGYTGLRVGQKIEIPGNDVTTAVKRLMRQQLFAQAQVKVVKIAGDKVWLELAMRTQPRISQVNYVGMKKGEREDLQERLQLVKGNPITPNIVNRANDIVKKYFAEKGFGNAKVTISQRPDLSEENHVIVDIISDKRDKIKVHKIYIDGNEVMSDNQLQRVMKKTNENGKLLNLFKQKKFVEQDYEDDLKRIIEKYNEKGYRDAKILADSVVPYDEKTVDVYISLEEGKKYYINDIQWVGNTVFNTDHLNSVLGIEPGSVYNQKLLNKRTKDDDDAVANYYLDNGYLFYQLIPIEKNVHGDSIDLELRMFEGPQARINKVIINGNDRLYEKVIRRELRVRPGQLFSKNDLMRSAREIAQTGHFNPEAMDIRPEPNEDDGTVDIVFNLESKANDQIEFSLGWGQTGIIGKLALKFTNFSIKNLFQPDSYKGLIPQGEGQTFTISAQTNARYYQAYSLSFLDPWFGGKRLSWPDDYFTFTTELSYNWYYLKNWDYLYYMNNGTSNALVLGLTLARNSIDNPLYTRRGSTFSVNLQLTPPASLFSGHKDWEALSKANTTESKKEMYRWIEYWKLRFKSRTYTPLNDAEQYTLVLMTRADFGLLGSYNKWLKSPFETFYVGGDGMSGGYTYATETIGLRGYDNGDLTPWGQEGYAYTRMGVELHFPFMLQPTTTIYGLGFVEGGNAWTSVKNFSPFELKRSAGFGVRIYLPMVGMMGIDWAYGFDKVRGTKGGSHFHFILGQEF